MLASAGGIKIVLYEDLVFGLEEIQKIENEAGFTEDCAKNII